MYMKGDSPSHQDEDSWSFNFINILLRESCPQPRSLDQKTTLRDIESHLISHAESNDFRTGPAKAMDIPAEIANTKWASAIAGCLENYTDNPTGFSLDLRHAVTRQSGFIAKMHMLLWIRAPSLPHTLSKSCDSYKKFLHLLGSGGQNLVPTLDIDLVWHTHQLCPSFYNFVTLRDTGRFINHDDRVVPAKLDTDFGRCKEMWREVFGEEYGGCLCWQCEQYSAVVAELVGSAPGDGDAVVDWRERVLNDQQRCEEAIQGLSEEEYASFVGDVRVTTKWYRDAEIGRQARLEGERVPYLRRDGLKEVRKELAVRS
jgi:Glycine-rich domain-containing protein-like